MCDTAGLGLILGQVIGRWGNFCNREAFGDYYDGLFAMQLPVSAVRTSDLTEKLMSHTTVVDGVEYISVHPTFLYESFWNLCLFILLMLYFKHRKFDGEVFLLYLLGYGIGRFWIESLRTDQLLIPHINYPVSMALAATLVAVSAIWIGIVRYKQMKWVKWWTLHHNLPLKSKFHMYFIKRRKVHEKTERLFCCFLWEFGLKP